MSSWPAIPTSLPQPTPFGSGINTRGYSAGKYRFGFNGKEEDGETVADAYEFGARIYDARLGRWLAVDPLFKKHSAFSAFNYCLNIPVFYRDGDGRDIIKPESNYDKHYLIPVLNACAHSKTFNHFVNQFVDIHKGMNPNKVSGSGSLSNVTLKIHAIDVSNTQYAGYSHILFKVKVPGSSELKEIKADEYKGNYDDIVGITLDIGIGYNPAVEHMESRLDKDAKMIELTLHEMMLHGVNQAKLIKEATVDGKVDYKKLQDLYKKAYPLNESGEDHRKLGTNSAKEFNKAAREVLIALQTNPEYKMSYKYGNVWTMVNVGSDGKLETSYGEIVTMEQYWLSDRFKEHVDMDIKDHDPSKKTPAIGTTTSTGGTVIKTITYTSKLLDDKASVGDNYQKAQSKRINNKEKGW